MGLKRHGGGRSRAGRQGREGGRRGEGMQEGRGQGRQEAAGEEEAGRKGGGRGGRRVRTTEYYQRIYSFEAESTIFAMV